MFELQLPMWGDIAVFLGAALVIGIAGVKAAGLADRLADRTGMGEAITGTIFLGFFTALPGLVASVVAALNGHAGLAISNAMGGIAIQTVALAVADLTYTKANLEHAAASLANMMQAIMLILLLTLVLITMMGPNVTVRHVHPMTIVLFAAAGLAFWLVHRTYQEPMWRPTQTTHTVEDVPEPGSHNERLVTLIPAFVLAAVLTAAGGAVVAETAENLVEETRIPEVVVGGLLMAGATSLPELVTSIAAVRRGALTLAVSNIVGGNFFDVLFVAAADLAFFQGSIFHAYSVTYRELFLTSLTILLNVVLLMGLIYRQRRGPANIGIESLLMLVIYIAGFLVVSFMM
ncbi:MAG: hypothetical protein WDZ59_00275 [Pirellulales bacterium]